MVLVKVDDDDGGGGGDDNDLRIRCTFIHLMICQKRWDYQKTRRLSLSSIVSYVHVIVCDR